MKNNNVVTSTEALFGAHPIIEALRAKRRKLISIYTIKPEPKSFLRVKPYLPASGKYTVNYVSKEALTKICGSPDHMGVVAWMGKFVYQSKFFSPKVYPQILILDSIQDVRNLGAILRTAYCTDFLGVVLCSSSGAKLTAASVKASAGLAEHLAIYVAPTAVVAVDLAKQAGYNVYLSALGGQDVRTCNIVKPICLVIGNEERGIQKNLIKSGVSVMLPQKESSISYNASVAAGILMFYFQYL